MYTEVELRNVNRNFVHRSIRSTENLLRRAAGGRLKTETLKPIRKISDDCNICKVNVAKPRSFKLTVGMDYVRFNNTVKVETMFIGKKSVIHMVYVATHLCPASFLRFKSSTDIWNSIQNFLSLVYLGSPDFLSFY